MAERMFTFRTSLSSGASVRCQNCGWTAKGRYGKTVFPKADKHVCSSPVATSEERA